MSEPTNWERLQAIVDAALDLSPVERRDAIARLCAAEPELRAEAERLLESCERAEGFLRQPAAELAGALMADELAEEPRQSLPERLGPYRIIREAGRGGMGTVYLAERDDGQFRKRVALKVMRGGGDGEGIVRRFVEERQILARLEHPHIARLLDGGVAPDGSPYLVMEFVEGVPIDRFCDGGRLPLRERLDLFIRVCRAVQYAHQNLVVHRDLKPSNILVDPARAPKLLDFGIAKLIDPTGGVGGAGITRTGLRPMTPEFASPEQVRGDSVTTASDVYALGVLLYVLLCGRHPYGEERRSVHALERAVIEREAAPPSAAVRRRGDDADVLAASRSTRPDRLSRRLRGDLDAIVLRALRKEPSQRYATADQLADDIQRHLDGQPVVARRGTRIYRASRLIRRHRVGMTAAGVVALTLVAGATATTWQARVAASERDRARAEAATSARVSAFLEELFRVSDPAEGRGAAVTARELLDRGSTRIARELAAEPEARTALMAVMGRAYGNLGEYARAEELLTAVLDARREPGVGSGAAIPSALLDLARVRLDRGDLQGSEAAAREALELSRRIDPDGPDVAAALTRLGEALHERGHHEAAEVQLREAVARRRGRGAGPELALSLKSLAHLLTTRGELDAAEPLYREALAIERAALGPDHPEIGTTLNDLGVLLYRRTDYPGSAALLQEALDMQRRLLGRDHPEVAKSVNNLAAVLEQQGRLAEAEPLYREALALKRQALGEEHLSVAVSMSNLALLLSDRGAHGEADSLLRRSLDVRRRLLGEDHPSVATALHNLASEVHRGGDPARAEELYRQTLRMRQRLLGPDHLDLASTSVALGLMLHERGAHGEGEALLRDALRVRRLKLPAGSWQLAAAESALGECLLAQRRPTEAAPLLRHGYQILLRERGAEDRATIRARGNVAKLERETAAPPP